MFSATDELAAFHIKVNAEVGRQFSKVFEAIESLEEPLPKRVVVHLGTNGPIRQTDMDALVELVGKRKLWLTSLWVPRDWERPNNKLIKATVAANANVFLIKWRALACVHPQWFNDGIHPNMEGQEEYAALISRTIGGV